MTLGFGVAVLSSDWAAHRVSSAGSFESSKARLDADAELQEVTISIFPRLSIDG